MFDRRPKPNHFLPSTQHGRKGELCLRYRHCSTRAFDEVFKSEKIGFDYIIHTASPVNFAVNDVKKDLINPAIQGYGIFRILL